MIVINRNNEAIIEDGFQRLSISPDGSGFIHDNGSVFDVEMHSPNHLIAARDAGLQVSDATIQKSREYAEEMYA